MPTTQALHRGTSGPIGRLIRQWQTPAAALALRRFLSASRALPPRVRPRPRPARPRDRRDRRATCCRARAATAPWRARLRELRGAPLAAPLRRRGRARPARARGGAHLRAAGPGALAGARRVADLPRGRRARARRSASRAGPLRRAARLHAARPASSSGSSGAGYRVEQQARLSPGLDAARRVGPLPALSREDAARASRCSTARDSRSTPPATPSRSTSASRRCRRSSINTAALHREPRAPRRGPPLPQPGGGLAAARQGGRGRDARAPRRRAALHRGEHAGHPDREVPALAGRAHAARPGRSCAR